MQHSIHSFDEGAAFDFLRHDAGERRSALAARWQSLDDAGRVIASLAQEPEPQPATQFAARIEAGADERHLLALRGVDDLAAMIEPGLSALLYICENGGDARAPAMALWREFSAARAALLALADLDEG